VTGRGRERETREGDNQGRENEGEARGGEGERDLRSRKGLPRRRQIWSTDLRNYNNEQWTRQQKTVGCASIATDTQGDKQDTHMIMITGTTPGLPRDTEPPMDGTLALTLRLLSVLKLRLMSTLKLVR